MTVPAYHDGALDAWADGHGGDDTGRAAAGGPGEAFPDACRRWVAGRNCSLTPRQTMAVYASLCAVSLSIATLFWWLGAGIVFAFAGVELLAVGIALLVHARHAVDRETIALHGGWLRIEHHCGSRVQRTDFRAGWAQVSSLSDGGLIEITGGGRRASVGRYLRPERRAALARELRLALRQSGGSARAAAGERP